VREAIEILIDTGGIDEDARALWQGKKLTLGLKRAKDMFDSGRVLDAAKLGLPRAQAEMARRYFRGSHGVDKDLLKAVTWAKKAAESGDMQGQFQMGYACAGGCGVEKNCGIALKWFQLAAAQGHTGAMRVLSAQRRGEDGAI